MPYFKDVATPADVADGSSVTGYAATESSPRAGSSHRDIKVTCVHQDHPRARGPAEKPIMTANARWIIPPRAGSSCW